MIAALRNLWTTLSRAGEVDDVHPVVFSDDDQRLCAAALLVHVASADGRLLEVEQERVRAVLVERFALSADDVDALLDAAGDAGRHAFDLDSFASTLKRALPAAERAAVVDMLWSVAHADGSVHEFEDNIIWRVTDLLGVPQRG
jgi:uncharacterized tellurite resistance protein B-like protein